MDILIENSTQDCFMVVDGGAMHLNNALALKMIQEKNFAIMNRYVLWQQKYMQETVGN